MNRTYLRWLVLFVVLIGTFSLTYAQTATPVASQTFTGNNWIGQFYNSPDVSGAVVATATFANGINKDWGAGSPTDGNNAPIAGVNADNWSARFTTTAQIAAGTYTFNITVEDGARVFIDSNLIMDTFGNNGLIGQAATVTLAGGNYTLIIDYNDKGGNARLQFSWQTSTGTSLTPGAPTATPVPAATGAVVGVTGLALRTGPYKGASLINVARPGKNYELLARSTSEGLYTWYLIKVSDTQQGWVSGRYLEITGDPNVLPFQGSVFDTIDAVPDVGARGSTRSVMNLRVRPSERTQRLTQIPWGDTVPIIGRTVQGGKDFWYQVIYQGRVGWIFAAYVTAKGNLESVPIR